MHGCYSGSAVVHEGSVRFLYTGNVFGPDGARLPHQNLATLESDGRVVKHPANPVVPPLDGYTGDIRDPKVWAQDGAYWMVLGAQTLDGVGTVLLLRSPDLLCWEARRDRRRCRGPSGVHVGVPGPAASGGSRSPGGLTIDRSRGRRRRPALRR